ncbi:MAG: hypothetical protein ACE5JJ_03065, partial [Nitrospinota bacterium]
MPRMRAKMQGVALGLFVVWLAAAAPPPAAAQPPAPAVPPSAAQIEQLARTLRDPKAREEL